jgi:serine/threonine protein kinase
MSTPDPAPAQALADRHGNALPLGFRLHEFEVTGLIGEGGFGIVYLARDTQLERTVAIKEYMPASLAARNDGVQVSVRSERHRETFALGMRSFVNEAKLLASFDHPALIKVYRFWEANGTAYMVMPYYQGPTLKNWLREQKVSPSEDWLKGVLSPLMDALEVIHADHCYHRDIAPDNILLLGPNKPLLLDFGAARRVIGDATQALTVILKPGYAPLEQYAEVPSMKQGPWTDVYALCAVLYAVITGKAPPPSVGRMMKDDLVPAQVAAAGRYSAPFLAAIDAGLTVHPDKRPPNMAALRALLYATRLPDDHVAPGGAADADDERTVLMPAPGGGVPTGFAPTEIATQLATQMATQMATKMPTQMAAPTASAGTPDLAGADAAPRVQKLQPTPATPSAASSATASPAGKRTGLVAAVGALVVLGAGAGFMAWRSGHAPGAETPTVTAANDPAAAGAGASSGAQAASAALTPMAQPSTAPVREPFTLAAALEGIVRGADPLLAVNTITDKSQLVIGKDKLLFQVKSSEPGYLYVYLAGTDQSHLYLLFPNALDKNNRIEANKLVELPRKGWHITAGGPPGVNHIVTMVSPYPRDLSQLGLNTQDSIPEFDVDKAKAMWEAHTGSGSPYVGAPQCEGKTPCETRYGASLVHIEEIATR